MKNEKQHSNKNDSTVKNTSLTAAQKRDRAILVALPRNSKLKELLFDKKITFEELARDIPAIMVGASFDRKLTVNMFSITIGLQSHLREVKKITREQLKRYKTRKNYSANQRRYLENRIVFGWSKQKEELTIASEIINILKAFNSNQVIRVEFEAGGINLGTIIRSISDKKEDCTAICEKVLYKLQAEGEQELMSRFKGVVSKAENELKNINGLVNVILKGGRRPYLPARRLKSSK